MVAPLSLANAAADCDASLCIDSGGGEFAADVRITNDMRRKQSKKKSGRLSLTIEDGRGSVFINGRYVGTAPVDSVKVPAGKNDIQVRDGADVLATGILTMPPQGDLSATVSP